MSEVSKIKLPCASEGDEDADEDTTTRTMPSLPPMSAAKDSPSEEGDEELAALKEEDAEIANSTASLANDFRGGQESWNAMLYQLLLYKAQRGDLNIPHNDTSYRLLYNWVQTQRKHYKLYQENKTSSNILNSDRIAVLDAIDFQWNVRGDTFWEKNFEALVAYKNEHGDVRVPRLYVKSPKLGEWVTDQRRQWKGRMEGKPSMMTDERKAKLDELGFVWKVRDRADWNDRYEQLLEFKKENGHCIVPQHYTRNRALGKWVAKQREQYRFYREGKHSFLTEERIDLLKSVAFVWQIKGRGVNKTKAAEAAAAAAENESHSPFSLPAVGTALGGGDDSDDGDAEEKSLAKMEEEERERDELESGCLLGMSSAAAVAAAAAAGAEELGLKKPPSLELIAKGGASTESELAGVQLGLGTSSKREGSDFLRDGSDLMRPPKRPSTDNGGGSVLPPPALALPTGISQQQLLRANMAAIAAHASSNQNMVADLAAVLRYGGGTTRTNGAGMDSSGALAGLSGSASGPSTGALSGLRDPSAAAAALRAARMRGSRDPKDPHSFMASV